jgi:hypothetical protein
VCTFDFDGLRIPNPHQLSHLQYSRDIVLSHLALKFLSVRMRHVKMFRDHLLSATVRRGAETPSNDDSVTSSPSQVREERKEREVITTQEQQQRATKTQPIRTVISC